MGAPCSAAARRGRARRRGGEWASGGRKEKWGGCGDLWVATSSRCQAGATLARSGRQGKSGGHGGAPHVAAGSARACAGWCGDGATWRPACGRARGCCLVGGARGIRIEPSQWRWKARGGAGERRSLGSAGQERGGPLGATVVSLRGGPNVRPFLLGASWWLVANQCGRCVVR